MELLVVSGLVAVMAAVAIPQSFAALDASRTKGAARYLAGRMAFARMQAVARSAYVAVRFQGTGTATSLALFVDGNGNGVRTRDITARVDRQIDGPARLADMFPGVAIGLATAAGRGEAVRIGSSRLLSFSPLSTATTGTVYVRGRDGTQLAVRVLGSTARTRVLKYVPGTGEWVPL